MLTLSLFHILASAAGMLLNLATGMLARSLNLPESLLRDTGFFVLARAQAVENSVGRRLCPIRLLRRLQNWRRQPAR